MPRRRASTSTVTAERAAISPRLLLATLAVAALGFAGGIAGYAVADRADGDDAPRRESSLPQPSNADRGADADPTPAADAPSGGLLSPRDLYRRSSPAVLHVTSKVTVTDRSFFGIPQEQEGEGTGSGFLLDDEGHIATNAHVVQDADTVTVSFDNDAEIDAKVVGADPSTDVAVLKVDLDDAGLERGPTPLPFGDSASVQVGDPVVAIGNPFSLDRTLTTGVVSALQRQIPALNDFAISGVIQTDAAVNPGNSGGPLLDMRGNVIGINSQIQSRGGGFDGIAFAVPSNTVKRVVEELIETGEVRHAWLGVAGQSLTPTLAEALDVDAEAGVVVAQVTDGSPADEAGLRVGEGREAVEGAEVRRGGDVIIGFEGQTVETMSELAQRVDARAPGDTVELEVLRDGRRRTLEVQLDLRPESREETDDEQ